MFTFPFCHYSDGVAGFLDSVLDSTEFEIFPVDGATATQINITTSPASGAGQTAYDFHLGADGGAGTDRPLFVSGSPDYLEYDSGDFNAMVGSNTTYLKNLHKTTGGQAFTLGLAFKTPATLGAFHVLFANQQGGAATDGIRLEVFGTDALVFSQVGTSVEQWTLATLSPNTDYLIFIAADFTSSTTNIEHWINTTTGTTDTDKTATATTTDPSTDFAFAGYPDGTFPLEADYRVYEWFAFNKVLSDAEVATAKTNIEANLGISF